MIISLASAIHLVGDSIVTWLLLFLRSKNKRSATISALRALMVFFNFALQS